MQAAAAFFVLLRNSGLSRPAGADRRLELAGFISAGVPNRDALRR
jgi:hypothetical protein